MTSNASAAQDGRYKPSGKPGLTGRTVGGYVAGALIALALVALLCTQYLAFRFGYQDALGKPLLDLGPCKIYEPFEVFRWYHFWGASADPLVATYFRHVMWGGAIGTGAIAFGSFYKVSQALKKAEGASRTDPLRGPVHCATPAKVRHSGLIGQGAELDVGAWKHPMTGTIGDWRPGGPEPTMAFTRSGEGVGEALPTLLAWRQSALIYDIDGEHWALTAGWRSKEANNKVLRFAPTAADGSSMCFNTLAQVRLHTGKEVADMQDLMTMLVDPDGKGLREPWQTSALALLVGAGLHVLYAEENKTLAGVAELLADPERSIQDTLRHLLATDHDLYGEGWRGPGGETTYTHPVVAAVARDMMARADEEMSIVLSMALSYLTLYRDPIVAANTSGGGFEVADLVNLEQPVSLYLVVPTSERDRLEPLIRLIIKQVVHGLTETVESSQGRSVAGHRHRLLLVIDELPNLGTHVPEEPLASSPAKA